MPLGALTNTDPSFNLIGRLKKGAPKTENSIGKDLDHWRPVFLPGKDRERIEQRFLEVYGKEPKDVNIRLPFDEVEKNWDAYLECYKNGVLVAKAGNTAERGYYWVYYRDPYTAQVLVRDGMPVGEEGVLFMQKPIDVTAPIYHTKNDNKPVYFSTYGRLRVIIPEIALLNPPVVGFFEVLLKSPKDIRNVSAELKAISQVAKDAGSKLFGIPMRLSRKEEEITKNIKGNLTRGISWMVHIALEGDWGSRALQYFERLALPDIVDGEVRELPQLISGREPQSAPEWFDNPDWDEPLESNDVSEVDEMFPPMPEEPQQPAESKAMPRQPDVPVINAKFLVEKKVVDNEPHAVALIGLLNIDGADPDRGMERIDLYNKWREAYPRKDAKTRKFCAEKAIAGEVPS